MTGYCLFLPPFHTQKQPYVCARCTHIVFFPSHSTDSCVSKNMIVQRRKISAFNFNLVYYLLLFHFIIYECFFIIILCVVISSKNENWLKKMEQNRERNWITCYILLYPKIKRHSGNSNRTNTHPYNVSIGGSLNAVRCVPLTCYLIVLFLFLFRTKHWKWQSGINGMKKCDETVMIKKSIDLFSYRMHSENNNSILINVNFLQLFYRVIFCTVFVRKRKKISHFGMICHFNAPKIVEFVQIWTKEFHMNHGLKVKL